MSQFLLLPLREEGRREGRGKGRCSRRSSRHPGDRCSRREAKVAAAAAIAVEERRRSYVSPLRGKMILPLAWLHWTFLLSSSKWATPWTSLRAAAAAAAVRAAAAAAAAARAPPP
jgi:hypothetical protein